MIRVYPHIIDCMCFFTVKFCQHPVVNSNQQMSEDGQETRGGRGILGRRREGNRQKMPLDTDGGLSRMWDSVPSDEKGDILSKLCSLETSLKSPKNKFCWSKDWNTISTAG